MSNLSFIKQVGDGVTNQFTLASAGTNIGYFRTEDIHVYVDNVEVTFTIERASPHLVILTTAPALGAAILIRREMPVDVPYADFGRGNYFGPKQVNNSFLQQLYTTHEILDGFLPDGHYFKQGVDLGGHALKNVLAAVDKTDGVNLEQLERLLFENTLYLPEWYRVGKFSDGVTFNKPEDFAIDAELVKWVYVGSDPFPKTVPAGFIPSNPDFQVINTDLLQYLSGLTEPSELDTVYNRRFDSIVALKAASDTLLVGQTVLSPMNTWVITDSASYTLPYINRVRSFNSLPLGNGKYAVFQGSTLFADDFLDESLTATSNDLAVGELSAIMRDGTKLDFSGKMYRVFANTAGVPSASATPATTVAQSLSQMLYMNNLRGISFGSGGLYAANQAATGTKMYYPSTLYVKQCIGVHFDVGSVFEAKGESFGDSDASFSLSKDARQNFLGQNGGHAVVLVRCKTITGSPTCRFAGSVGPLYFSSCEDIRLVNPFSNPASLGYASYSFDGWTGNTVETGRKNFHGTITNPISHAEVLTRREDGVVTSNGVYCGKGGVLTEDSDVVITCLGGHISDMYANGSAKNLGYAFGAGVHSKCISVGAVVRNCQEVAYANVTANGTSECVVLDVDAVVGLTGMMFDNQPYGTCKITLKGKVLVDGSRVWSGATETLSKTSLVASMKAVSGAYAVVDCDAGPVIGTVGIYSLISNTAEASYGGVVIEGGNYVTNGYIMRSEGWGASQAGSRTGLVIKQGTIIRDESTTAVDSLIFYKNKSTGNVFTYLYHDISGAEISAAAFRALDLGYSFFGSGLVEQLLFPRRMGKSTYIKTMTGRPRETLTAKFVSAVALNGSDSRMKFAMVDGRPPAGVCYLPTDTGLARVSYVYPPYGKDPLMCELLIAGDVRNNFTVGSLYTLLGA